MTQTNGVIAPRAPHNPEMHPETGEIHQNQCPEKRETKQNKNIKKLNKSRVTFAVEKNIYV